MDDIVESKTPKNVSIEVVTLETDPDGNNCPSHNEIAVLAYSYWEARGYQGGSPEEDWLRAELELNGKHEAA